MAPSEDDSPTIGILCALAVELSAVLSCFDDKPRREEVDKQYYYFGRLAGQVAVATCLKEHENGLDNASHHAAAMVNSFPSLKNPSHRFMVGIAGGIPSEKNNIRLGDVVIATKHRNYGRGRYVNGELEHTDCGHLAPENLRGMIPDFKTREQEHKRDICERIETILHNHQNWRPGSDDNWLYLRDHHLVDTLFKADYRHQDRQASNCEKCDQSMIEHKCERQHPFDEVKIHYGLIISSDQVLKDGDMRQKLQKKFTDVLAVDMESSALRADEFIVVRGISDYADSHKNDDWQTIAAVAAAACTMLLIEDFADQSSKSPSTEEVVRAPASSAYISDPGTSEAQPTSLQDQQSESWSFGFSFDHVTLRDLDGDEKGETVEDYLEGNMTIRELSNAPFYKSHRELVLNDSAGKVIKDKVLWLPLTHVRARLKDRNLSLWYSSCNARFKQSPNHANRWRPIYAPDKPNMKVDITFKEVSAANTLLQHLHYYKTTVPGHESYEAFDNPRWQAYKSDASDELLVRHLLQLDNEYESTEFLHLGAHLDFHIDINCKSTSIHFFQAPEIIYNPAQTEGSTWPLDAVKANPSGKPSSYGFSHESCSKIKVSRDCQNDLFEVLTVITGGWKLKTDPFEASDSGFQILEKSKKEITIWSKNDNIKILARTKSKDNGCEWTCIDLPKLVEQDAANPSQDSIKIPSKQMDNKKVALKNVQETRGVCLKRSDMTLIEDTETDKAASPGLASQVFKFESSDEQSRFANELEGYVATQA